MQCYAEQVQLSQQYPRKSTERGVLSMCLHSNVLVIVCTLFVYAHHSVTSACTHAESTMQVIHARWAMLGAAGCIAPEILGKAGVIPAETAVDWFRTGVTYFSCCKAG